MTAADLPFTLVTRWRSLRRPIRYVAVGGFCALLNNVLLIGFVEAGFNYLTAIWLACGPMMLVGFALHTSATFNVEPSFRSFLRYSAAILVNYPIWIGSLYVLCDVVALPIYFASFIATGVMFVWNYISAHWALLSSFRAAFQRDPARGHATK